MIVLADNQLHNTFVSWLSDDLGEKTWIDS